ncbi:MAG: hypothetical protein EAX96_09915 [Candidatus Lokiarchaeota archaeon]|nr:hypothetical protein [Candidatus Lokiarchaeota archaeon]
MFNLNNIPDIEHKTVDIENQFFENYPEFLHLREKIEEVIINMANEWKNERPRTKFYGILYWVMKKENSNLTQVQFAKKYNIYRSSLTRITRNYGFILKNI